MGGSNDEQRGRYLRWPTLRAVQVAMLAAIVGVVGIVSAGGRADDSLERMPNLQGPTSPRGDMVRGFATLPLPLHELSELQLDADGDSVPDPGDGRLAGTGLRPWDGDVGVAGRLAPGNPGLVDGDLVAAASPPALAGGAAGQGSTAAGAQQRGDGDTDGASEALDGIEARVTFYVCVGAPPGFQDGYCGDGAWPYPGVAACGSAFERGVHFTIDGDPYGREWVCDDVGAYYWWPGWEWTVEPWFYDYAEGRWWRDHFGETVTVRIAE